MAMGGTNTGRASPMSGPTFSSTSSVTTRVLAAARSIPVRWGGTIEDLPAGIEGAIARGFDGELARTLLLCALLIMVPRDLQGRGVSAMTMHKRSARSLAATILRR